MRNKSLKKNYIYNLILTSLNLIFPLITSPYLSSVLGATNIGKVNYANSLINWFILFAAFGIPRYGIREISKNRDDRKTLTNSFWNLIIIQFILSIIAIVIYLIIIFNVDYFESEISLYLVMSIMILLNIFSIDWFYQGVEEYGYITIRNIIFKIISIVLIFAVVKNREQYILYAVINVFGLSFNNVLNYFHAFKYIDKKLYDLKIIKYLKQLRVYFFTTFIISIYTQLDQIMVGNIAPSDLAYYMRSKTALNIGMGVTNSVVTVFIPRSAYLIQNNYYQYKKMIEKSINYIYILAVPCVVGFFLLSDEIMLLLGGTEFLPASISLKIICFLILINSIGAWQINQILIPHKFENTAFYIQCFGAAFSIVLNLILITKKSYIGAAITWTLTELILAILGSFIIRKRCKEIKIKYINNSFIKYLISSVSMSIIVIYIKNIIENLFLSIVLSAGFGAIIYFILLIILKDDNILQILALIRKKIQKNK